MTNLDIVTWFPHPSIYSSFTSFNFRWNIFHRDVKDVEAYQQIHKNYVVIAINMVAFTGYILFYKVVCELLSNWNSLTHVNTTGRLFIKISQLIVINNFKLFLACYIWIYPQHVDHNYCQSGMMRSPFFQPHEAWTVNNLPENSYNCI